MLETLRYLHELLPPVIHRDIKPDNIVLRESGAPVLVDFGAVRDLALPGHTGGATVLGTPGYTAPEQSLGRSSARSDLLQPRRDPGPRVHPPTPPRSARREHADRRRRARAAAHTHPQLLTALTRIDPTARPESAAAAIELLEGRARTDDAPSTALVAKSKPPRAETAVALLAPGEMQPAPPGGRELTAVIKQELTNHPPRSEKVGRMTAVIISTSVALGVAIPLVAEASMLSVLLVPLMMIALVGGTVGTFFRRRAQRLRLYQRGNEVRGRVTAASSAQTGSFIDYEYEVDGQRYEGYCYSRDSLALARLDRGSPVRVFYDPQQPDKSVGIVGGR